MAWLDFLSLLWGGREFAIYQLSRVRFLGFWSLGWIPYLSTVPLEFPSGHFAGLFHSEKKGGNDNSIWISSFMYRNIDDQKWLQSWVELSFTRSMYTWYLYRILPCKRGQFKPMTPTTKFKQWCTNSSNIQRGRLGSELKKNKQKTRQHHFFFSTQEVINSSGVKFIQITLV